MMIPRPRLAARQPFADQQHLFCSIIFYVYIIERSTNGSPTCLAKVHFSNQNQRVVEIIRSGIIKPRHIAYIVMNSYYKL